MEFFSDSDDQIESFHRIRSRGENNVKIIYCSHQIEDELEQTNKLIVSEEGRLRNYEETHRIRTSAVKASKLGYNKVVGAAVKLVPYLI